MGKELLWRSQQAREEIDGVFSVYVPVLLQFSLRKSERDKLASLTKLVGVALEEHAFVETASTARQINFGSPSHNPRQIDVDSQFSHFHRYAMRVNGRSGLEQLACY